MSRPKALIISPQHWGKLRISKHHYASALAQSGYSVYFLNPIEPSWTFSLKSIRASSTEYDGVTVIDHRPFVPYNFKFHWSWLFNLSMRLHVKWLMKQLEDIDLIWSFDLTNTIPLTLFRHRAKVFFAADWPADNDAVWAAESCNLLISVAPEILDVYPQKHNKLLVNHGVAECFIKASEKVRSSDLEEGRGKPLRIGVTGNLLRPDIDRKTLLTIISNHPNCSFEFFGPTSIRESNIGGSREAKTRAFLQQLKKLKNTQLHGALSPQQLALEYCNIDAFLICYDPERDQSKATNYHKIAEFLTYGVPVISNYVSAYDFEGSGVLMVRKNENFNLPELFKKTIEVTHQRLPFNPTSYLENTERILQVLKQLTPKT